MSPSLATFASAFRAAWEMQAPAPRPRTAFAITSGVLVLVLAVVAGQMVSDSGPAAWAVGLDLAVGVAGAVALPAALRRPLMAAAAFVILSAVSPAATPLAGTALLWLAQHGELQVSVAVGAAGVMGQVAQEMWRPNGRNFGWWLVVVAAGFAAVVGWGAWSRARRQLLESLVERARRAEEEQSARVTEARRAERARIAREMHDVLAHRLSLLATFAGAVEYNREAPPDRLVEAAKVIRTGAHDALADLRQVVDVLRAEDGDAADGGASPPQPDLADLPGLVDETRRTGARVALEILDDAQDAASVPPLTGRTVFRVVQEALTNARKHAPGRPVRVVMSGRTGGSLTVEVHNPLAGDAAQPLPGSGAGLVGMAERVRLAGGEFDAGPDGDGHFRVRARLPWPK